MRKILKYEKPATTAPDNTNDQNQTTVGTDQNQTLAKLAPEFISSLTPGISSLIALLGDSNRDTAFSEQQQIGQALLSINPYVGAAYMGLSSIAEAADLNSSKMSKSTADALGIGGFGQAVNNGLAFIPFTGAWGSTKTAYKSDAVDKIAAGFGGTAYKINQALEMGNQKYALGSSKANSFISDSNNQNDIMSRIEATNTLAKQNTSSQEYNAQYINRITNANRAQRSAFKGMKFLSREELDRIYSKNNVSKFQNGGSILIPDGELHARKHHMEEVNPELAEDLTKKGIPVIITDNNSEVEQVAEIEKEEMIFEKSLTDKIEDLRKEGTEEAMLEAGKLIVETLFNNCDDNANLVKEVE